MALLRSHAVKGTREIEYELKGREAQREAW